MHDAFDLHVVDLVQDEYSDVSPREKPLAIPTPDPHEHDEVDMHVMLDDGHFHREVTHKITACRKKIALTGLWRRPAKYDANDGDYCRDGCFSDLELEIAYGTKVASAEVERELDAEWNAGDWRTRRPVTEAERTRRVSERLSQKLILADPAKKDDKP